VNRLFADCLSERTDAIPEPRERGGESKNLRLFFFGLQWKTDGFLEGAAELPEAAFQKQLQILRLIPPNGRKFGASVARDDSVMAMGTIT
jgi:hypothetical protein